MPVRPINRGQRPWNKGLLIGQKKPLEPKHVWFIRVRLEIARSRPDLTIFNVAIDSKLRACDLVKLRIDDICSGANVRRRATIVQKKTGRPVPFEITEQSTGNTRKQGVGLGLSIFQEIMAAHGGDLVITSAQDGGTTASLRFPEALVRTDELNSLTVNSLTVLKLFDADK